MRRTLLAFASVLGALAAGSAAIVLAGMNDKHVNGDVIVVPGNTVYPDGTPSPRLKARLDAALLLFREGIAPRVFVSGGTGKEGFDEAVAMARYLSAHGVPESVIVVDSNGVDTAATARHAAEYMRDHGLRSALVATQYFHVPRMRLALERHGIEVTGTVHARFVELRDLYSIPREAVAYVSYAMKM